MDVYGDYKERDKHPDACFDDHCRGAGGEVDF